MKIGGPFFDSARRSSPLKWYLSYFVPKVDAAGAVILRDGKAVQIRKRPYYATKEKAQADKPRLEAQLGIAGGATAGDEHGGILSLAEATEFREAKRIVAEVNLPELARFWRKHHPLTATEKILPLSARFLLEVKGKVSDRHYSDLNSRVPMFARAFAERLPATLTRAEILAWLQNLAKSPQDGGRGLAGRTVLNIKRCVVNFLNWLIEAETIAINPIARLKRRQLPKIEKKEIEFLGIDYVRRYLAAAERYDPEIVAHEVIQLFSGVRSDDEMADFDGRWVLPATREIVIPSEIAKTERREVLDNLEPNFWAWWAAYGRTGILRPKNYEPRWKRIRILAETGTTAKADELARLPIKPLLDLPAAAALLTRWPWNARRRTFCTYHVAKHQSADKTALILRHRGDVSTLHDSYRGLGVTQAQGAELFTILPSPEPRPAAIRPERPAKGIIRRQNSQ